MISFITSLHTGCFKWKEKEKRKEKRKRKEKKRKEEKRNRNCKAKEEKVNFRSQILVRPSIGEYWNTFGVPVLPENVIFTFFRMCWCYSEAYNTGTQKWFSIVQYSCTSIWDFKYTFSAKEKRKEMEKRNNRKIQTHTQTQIRNLFLSSFPLLF